ncbi:hypothetical protein SBADM41S_11605 [Streptomyces badius]
MGIDWWEHDPSLSSRARPAQGTGSHPAREAGRRRKGRAGRGERATACRAGPSAVGRRASGLRRGRRPGGPRRGGATMNTEWDAPVGAPGGGAGEMSYVYAVGRAGPALDGLAARLPGVDEQAPAPCRGGRAVRPRLRRAVGHVQPTGPDRADGGPGPARSGGPGPPRGGGRRVRGDLRAADAAGHGLSGRHPGGRHDGQATQRIPGAVEPPGGARGAGGEGLRRSPRGRRPGAGRGDTVGCRGGPPPICGSVRHNSATARTPTGRHPNWQPVPRDSRREWPPHGRCTARSRGNSPPGPG